MPNDNAATSRTVQVDSRCWMMDCLTLAILSLQASARLHDRLRLMRELGGLDALLPAAIAVAEPTAAIADPARLAGYEPAEALASQVKSGRHHPSHGLSHGIRSTRRHFTGRVNAMCGRPFFRCHIVSTHCPSIGSPGSMSNESAVRWIAKGVSV